MTDEQIIETAMHVHASKRDAIWWAMKQVRMQANTHQLPSVSEPNTTQLYPVVQLIKTLKIISVWSANGDGQKDFDDIRKLADEAIDKATDGNNDSRK